MFATSSPASQRKKSDVIRFWTCFLFVIWSPFIRAQSDTEIFFIALDKTAREVGQKEFKNLSQNTGYDNQPSFYQDHLVMFSSTRNGQTDVALLDLRDDSLTWKTETSGGGEYSPQRIPGSDDFSAIRLDVDGKQLLYQYDWKSGRSKPINKDLKVGYHVWFSREILVSAVLVADRMDLVVSSLQDHTDYTFQRNIGRSLHKIPNTALVSFVNKEDGKRELKSVDPVSGATKVIAELPEGVEDVCWLGDGTLLAGKDNRILKFDPESEGNWIVFREFPGNHITNITRMATDSASNILLFTAEFPE